MGGGLGLDLPSTSQEHSSRFLVFNGSLSLVVASVIPSGKFRNVVEFQAACVEFHTQQETLWNLLSVNRVSVICR